jgi:hypothetical protein
MASNTFKIDLSLAGASQVLATSNSDAYVTLVSGWYLISVIGQPVSILANNATGTPAVFGTNLVLPVGVLPYPVFIGAVPDGVHPAGAGLISKGNIIHAITSAGSGYVSFMALYPN